MADTSQRQAGIEITDEMIEAGEHELFWFDRERDNGREFISRLFRAMAAVAPPYNAQSVRRDDHPQQEPE